MNFISSLILTTSLVFGFCYALIWGIDPYNKTGNNIFNLETKAVDFARVNKFNQVEFSKHKYNAFIMGSSSAHRYHTDDLNRLTEFSTYNYSTQSATPEDYLAMTRHILTKYDVKLLILSFDFEALNKYIKTDDMFFASPLKNFLKEDSQSKQSATIFNNTYFTLSALTDSLKVIWVNLFGKARHAYLEHGNHIKDKIPAQIKIVQFSGKPFEIDINRLNYLREILRLSKKHSFKIIALTSPLSSEHLNQIESDPVLKNNLQEFKMELVKIFGEIWDFENSTIHEFNQPQYFLNSNHPSQELSALILERIMGKRNTPGILLKNSI